MIQYLSLFLLGISSLLPLINPLGTAIIIDPYFKGVNLHDRKSYSLKISFYCLILGMGALFLGSWCLKFMGVSVQATQIAGGLVIGKMGLSLLDGPKTMPPQIQSRWKSEKMS